MQTIASVATALLQVSQPEWKDYARQVIKNAQTLANALVKHGYKLQTGGTDNHLVLWDLRPLGLTGSKVEKVCDLLGITINSTCPPLSSSMYSRLARKRGFRGRVGADARRDSSGHICAHLARHG